MIRGTADHSSLGMVTGNASHAHLGMDRVMWERFKMRGTHVQSSSPRHLAKRTPCRLASRRA